MKIEKKMLILQNRIAYIPPQACPRRLRLYKKLHCSLSSLYVLLVSLQYFCFQILVFQNSFSVNHHFLIYFSFFYISTIHHYLTSFSFWHSSLFPSEEGGRRSLLSYDLHYSGHFLINAVDKAVAHHLIRRRQATPHQKFTL